MKRSIVIIFILFAYSFSFGQDYLDVTEDSSLKFPDAFYYQKDYRVQWWYFTGHLFDENGREFGYELTFFVVNVQKRDYRSRFGVNRIFISHFAVSDVAGNLFHFADTSDTGAYGFAGAENNRLRVWIEDNLLDGSIENIHLKASDGEKAIDLHLMPVKPVVLHGENGYSRKSEESPLIASLYFSYPQMNTEGRLTLGGKVFRVRGKTWFDREISTRELSPQQAGWDWVAVQLDDNREIMLYVMRNKDGSVDQYSSGTFVYADGKYRRLSKDEFSVDVLSYYNSRKTGARYPSQWEIRIPSEKLMVRIIPLIQDQEVLAYYSTGNYYWEGTCRVQGTARGRAYVEMTGY